MFDESEFFVSDYRCFLRPAPCALRPALTFQYPADARKSEVRKVNQLKFNTSSHHQIITLPHQQIKKM
jgi:hypothetical protein